MKAARAVVGGVAMQRDRVPQRRGKQLRGYIGTLSRGVLSCSGGAWVKTAGSDDEKHLDKTRKLVANLGDVLIVIGSDVAAVRIVEIVNPGWSERWRVETIYGSCNDGAVVVMKGPRS